MYIFLYNVLLYKSLLFISTLYNGTVGFPAKFNAHYYNRTFCVTMHYYDLWPEKGSQKGKYKNPKVQKSKSFKFQKFKNPKVKNPKVKNAENVK